MEYFFLIIFFSGSYYFANIINSKIFKKNNDEILNIFSISIIFLLVYLINSYQLIFNIKGSFTNYFITIIICLSSFFYFKEILKKKKFFFNFKEFNYLVLLICFLYLILMGFQAADEDSLRYHLPIAKKILEGSFFKNHWLDYITISSHEFINVLFLYINIDNGSSIINFIFLLLYFKAAVYFFKNNNLCNKDQSNLLIVLSSPYLVSLLTSQKLYFMPSLLVTLVFVYLYLNFKKIDNLKLHLMGLVIIFCFVTKATFTPYFILFFISVFWIKKNKKDVLFFYIYQFVAFLVIYFPILYIKNKIYNDPFIPFVSINSDNFEWYKQYKFWLTAWEMDYTDNIKNIFIKLLATPLKLILPLSLSDIFKCLGIGILFIFTISNKNKYTFLLLIFFFLNVFLLFNTQTRWFLPFLILISFLATFKKSQLLSKAIKIQSIAIIALLIPLASLTIAQKINLIEKNYVKKLFIDSYKINVYLKENYKNKKIFTSLNTFFFFDNYVPIYYPEIILKIDKNFYKKNYKNGDLILWDDRKNMSRFQSFEEFIKKSFDCNNFEHMKEFVFNSSRFFILNKRKKINLYRLKC